ncbi:hypothetical protein PM3016_7012 [Paenibacillus mucilaginosus 3016]|uniref:Phosphoglycerate mutase n=2 Tax=Paenibacillus mucilaginosus TaxID=61624 RepID=H6NRG8_9BACL|nr:histidine phosphatase family protein [Paenibacillus mucilaginosus]AFC33603.1 hypothetical protein PM3016_7012 [Paenibacillus mucilaginosus 3016]AFH65928.1 hypothetical protein B2K_35385 [Paenibacillus mucilaginosus K02]WFA22001.1 hypothetical protein ERY13_34810 [Paenibacillus mucilaginosus]
MKIGLVRHFKVKRGLPAKGWMSGEELTRWFTEYDQSEVEIGTTEMNGIQWQRCYASDMPRARITAQTIHSGPIRYMEGLREIPYPAFERISQRRLPIIGWLLWMRAAWLLGHGAFQESRAGVRARAARVVDEITAEGDGVNILLVGHAAFMQELSRELRRRGFKGPRFRRAANGQLYLFERQG